MKVSGVINSNINNFCSPNKFANAHISRINPDKSTFLNSNLLVSNILNQLSPCHETETNLPDAYANSEQEMLKNCYDEITKKDKIMRVNHLVKCRSQTALIEMKVQEDKLRKQMDRISLMRIQMNEKARDIMSKKEDTAYLGRNLFLEGEKFLKQMKDANPTSKINKNEATRMLMKERAKNKGRNNQSNQNINGEENSQFINQSSSNQLNSSISSNMQGSMDTYMRRKDSTTKETDKDQHIAHLIRNGSFESVMLSQKRRATWKGFTDNWAQGFLKNDDLITTKKKRKVKKSPRQKYLDISDNAHLDYDDKFSRHLALNTYKETFNKTAASYQIVSR